MPAASGFKVIPIKANAADRPFSDTAKAPTAIDVATIDFPNVPNGDISEFTMEDWLLLDLFPSYPPEDWALVWELSEEDRNQCQGNYEYHYHLENIECETVEDAFETLSHSIEEEDFIERDDDF